MWMNVQIKLNSMKQIIFILSIFLFTFLLACKKVEINEEYLGTFNFEKQEVFSTNVVYKVIESNKSVIILQEIFNSNSASSKIGKIYILRRNKDKIIGEIHLYLSPTLSAINSTATIVGDIKGKVIIGRFTASYHNNFSNTEYNGTFEIKPN